MTNRATASSVARRATPSTVTVVSVTQGARGAQLVTEDQAFLVPGKKIEVVDTVGAGDSFTAALVVTLLQGRSLRECVEIANAVGALVASHAGAMPELKSEFKAILESSER